MRQGPKKSSREPRPSPPKGVDSTRAGIRALDCGDDAAADEPTTIVRRADPATPPPGGEESASLGEQRQSV
jgi:hypothetical protein